MEFIDHTGHIFSVNSYSTKPIGYQYDINDYIFWLDSEYTHKLSVDNYYITCIRMLLPKEFSNLNISLEDSDTFNLLSTVEVHNLVDNMQSLNDYIKINESNSFYKSLNESNLIAVDLGNFTLIPFYVIGNSPNEGSIVNNILISYESKGEEIWTPISIGGDFYAENEPLIINGKNMGVDLPKDILGAIYQYSYYSEVPDETLYSNKIKEYLLSFMHLKGQIGNFNSVLDSIKWFGYSDKIEIQKLLQTDNQFQNQFFLDNFTITTDLLYSYKSFRASTYLSLRLWDNQEYEDYREEPQIVSKDKFWGEGKPELEDLFKKTIIKHYDEGDLDFYRSYYDWCFDELGLKLAMLDYYFKKYFLPIHLHLHSTSIAHQVWANDVKMVNVSSNHITEQNVNMGSGFVKFKDTSNYYMFNQIFYTDIFFNNMSYIADEEEQSYFKTVGSYLDEQVLYINQTCVEVPITIEGNGYFDCHLLLLKDDKVVYESGFQICQSNEIRYKSFIILPKFINDTNNQTKNYWLDSDYKIAFLCNDRWYYHKFNIRMPEMQLNFGTLQYRYYNYTDDVYRTDVTVKEDQLADKYGEDYQHKWGDTYDQEKWGPDTYDINTRYVLDSNNSLHKQLNRLIKDDNDEANNDIDFNAFMYVPSLVETNDINFYDKLYNLVVDVHGGAGESTETELPTGGFTSQTGILTKKNLINKARKKTYLKDFSNNGIKFDDRTYASLDTIIPEFYFNDYTRDNNQKVVDENYQLEQFYTDIYVGFFTKNGETVPFAKTQLWLVKDGEYNEELLNNNPYGLVKNIRFRLKDWDPIFAGPDEDYAMLQPYYKEEIEQARLEQGEDIPVEELLLPFKINPCVLQTEIKHLTLRFVWSVKLKEEQKFQSSYNSNGYPIDGFFHDIVINVQKKQDDCTLDCWLAKNGLTHLCKFKANVEDYEDVKQEYDKSVHDFFSSGEIIEEADNLMTQIINKNIVKSQSDTIIANNNEFLNRIHIYNIYHTGYKGKINKLNGKDIYEEYDNNEINKLYFEGDSETSLFDQNPSSIVPLKYNKNKYGDYELDMEEYLEAYDDHVRNNLVNLYSLFFESPNGEQLFEWPTKSSFDYDFYLMHDKDNWYVVFISQLPLAFGTQQDFEAPKELSYIDPRGHEFILKHYRSGNNFLINRMYFESANGKNIFKKNQLIVGTIDNVNFPVILSDGAKWSIEPKSLGIDPDICTSLSNANSCIFSIGTKNQSYSKGYYDVKVRYSIDGNTQHQQIAQGRIRVVD